MRTTLLGIDIDRLLPIAEMVEVLGGLEAAELVIQETLHNKHRLAMLECERRIKELKK